MSLFWFILIYNLSSSPSKTYFWGVSIPYWNGRICAVVKNTIYMKKGATWCCYFKDIAVKVNIARTFHIPTCCKSASVHMSTHGCCNVGIGDGQSHAMIPFWPDWTLNFQAISWENQISAELEADLVVIVAVVAFGNPQPPWGMAEEPAGFSRLWVVPTIQQTTKSWRSWRGLWGLFSWGWLARLAGCQRLGWDPEDWKPKVLAMLKLCLWHLWQPVSYTAAATFFLPDRLLSATSHFWLLKCRDIDNLGGFLL